MMEAYLYVAAAMAYGLLGLALSASYHWSPRLRESAAFHMLTVGVFLIAAVVATVGAKMEFDRLRAYHFGAQFFIFLGASLCYLPAALYLALHYLEVFLERIMLPASRQETSNKPLTQAQQWDLVQSCLERLTRDPTDVTVRHRLADLYAHLGFADSAAYEYQKTAKWLERGYAHSLVLYKAARILVESGKDPSRAIVILRRIIRLYPRSCFAAYARRVLSHYEAHSGLSPGRNRRA
jgi:hypothetical protein